MSCEFNHRLTANDKEKSPSRGSCNTVIGLGYQSLGSLRKKEEDPTVKREIRKGGHD